MCDLGHGVYARISAVKSHNGIARNSGTLRPRTDTLWSAKPTLEPCMVRIDVGRLSASHS